MEGLGYAQASTTVTTEAYVNITGRVTILDRYNTVNIRSDASGRRISTTGSSDMGGFSAKPDTSTYTNLTLKAGIIENEAVMLTVEARKVLITACNGELEVTENAYAKGSAAFGDVDSRVHFTAYLDTKVYLENADITGHERFQAQASSNPSAINGDNIDILSRMKLDAAGEGTAHYVVKIYPTAVVDIAPGFTYRGAEFIATRSLIKESRINYRARTSGFATQKKDPSYKYEPDGYVKANSPVLYLGSAAGGIWIDISARAVRWVGLPSGSSPVTDDGSTLSVIRLVSNIPGKALVEGTLITPVIYDQSWIRNISITNRTEKDLLLSSMTLQNTGMITPVIKVNGAQEYPISHSDYVPWVRITTTTAAGVRVRDLIPNWRGAVTFEWTGKTGGALTSNEEVTGVSSGANTAPVWAHDLKVVNASSVGTFATAQTLEEKFSAWIFAGSAGKVDITAAGDINVSLRAASMSLVDVLPDAGYSDTSLLDMDIVKIKSTEGSADVTLSEGVNVFNLIGTNTVTMPVPGTLEFVTGSLADLSRPYVMNGMDYLGYYMSGYDSATDSYVYTLPNGTVFIMDRGGNVISIVEEGTSSDVGVYGFVYTDDTMTTVKEIILGRGIGIDLITGDLTVDENSTYELLLGSVSAKWFSDNGLFDRNNGITIKLTELSDDGEGRQTATDVVTYLVRLYSPEGSGITYYYFSSYRPSPEALDSGSAKDYYLLEHNANTDSIALYRLKTALSGGSATNYWTANKEHLEWEDGNVFIKSLSNGYSYYEAANKGNMYKNWQLDEEPSMADCPLVHLPYVVNAPSTSFEVTDFLGTDLTVRVTTNSSLNQNRQFTYEVKIGGTWTAIDVISTPLGYTVSPTGTGDVYTALRNIYWTQHTAKENQRSMKVTGTDVVLTPNFGSEYGFAEMWYVQRNKDNPNKPNTQKYRIKYVDAQSWTVSFRYIAAEPVSVFMANESSYTGVRYETDIPGTYVYDSETSGEYVDSYGNKVSVGVQVIERKDTGYRVLYLGDSPYMLPGTDHEAVYDQSGLLRYDGASAWYRLGYINEDGVLVYDDSPYTVKIDSSRLVLPLPESGTATGGGTEYTVTDGDVTYKFIRYDGRWYIITAEGLREVQYTQISDGVYGVAFDESSAAVYQASAEAPPETVLLPGEEETEATGKKYITDEEGNFYYIGASTGTSTLEGEDPPVTVTYYSGTSEDETESYTFAEMNGSLYLVDGEDFVYIGEFADIADEYAATGNIYVLDENGEKIAGEKEGTWVTVNKAEFDSLAHAGDRASLIGHPVSTASIMYLEDITDEEVTPYYVYFDGAGRDIALDGASALAVLARIVSEETPYYRVVLSDGTRTMFDPGSPQLYVDPDKQGEGTDIVIRIGEKGDTITITGRIEDIAISSAELPHNSRTPDGTRGFRFSDTMYVTESGLVVQINGDFASSFDGEIYISDRITATALGRLAVENENVPVNNEGLKIHVVEKGESGEFDIYVLRDGVFWCAETGAGMSPEETQAILYEVAPMNNTAGPVVTINPGEKVLMIEKITDKVAVDVTGRYWYSADGKNWTEMSWPSYLTPSWWKAPYHGTKLDPTDEDDMPYYDEAAGGEQYLLTAEIRKSSSDTKPFVIISRVVDGNGKELRVFYTLVEYGVRAGSDGSVVKTDDTTLPQTFRAAGGYGYSIGRIEAAGDVTIRIADPYASILDGDDPARDSADVIAGGDILIVQHTDENGRAYGTIGSEDNLIDFVFGGDIDYVDESGNHNVIKDSFIYVPEKQGADTVSDYTFADDVSVAPGVSLTVITQDGSIRGENLTAHEGSKVTLKTNIEPDYVTPNSGAASPGDVHITNLVTDGADTDITAAGSVSITDTRAAGGSITISAAGDIEADTLKLDGTEFSAEAGGSYASDTIDARGTGRMHIAAADVTAQIVSLDGSIADITARAGRVSGDDLIVVDSTAVITALTQEGTVSFRRTAAVRSTLTETAEADVLFNSINAKESCLTLTAAGTAGIIPAEGTPCGEYGSRAFIRFAETDTAQNAYLSVSARSVGTSASHLIADIPEGIVMHIPSAGGTFIDSLVLYTVIDEWPSDAEGLVSDGRITDFTVSHPDDPFINEETGMDPTDPDSLLEGDKLGDITEKLVSADVTIQTPEEIAERLIESGTQWLDLIDEEALRGLIGTEGFTAEDLAELIDADKLLEVLDGLGLTEGLTEEERAALVSEEKLIETIGKLIEFTVEKKDDTTDPDGGSDPADPGSGSDPAPVITTPGIDELAAMLRETSDPEKAKLLAEKLIALQTDPDEEKRTETITDLGSLIYSLLTDEEKLEIIKAAILEAGMPEEASGGIEDPEPKAFSVEFGTTTGLTYIYNDGDIRLTVKGESDLTIGLIRSERGDVSVSVENGSIRAAGLNQNEADIVGENIVLKASGNIGTAAKPIVTESRQDRPSVDVNVIASTAEGTTGTVRMEKVSSEDGTESLVWKMDVALDYDFIRTDHEDALMRLDASAGGSLYVEEKSGPAGAGYITAGDAASITVIGDSLYDVRTPEEKASAEAGITSDRLILDVSGGTIGTYDEPVTVDIGTHADMTAKGDIYVDSVSDLDATADTADGKYYMHSEGSLTLRNTSGGMVLEEVSAKTDLTVASEGDIISEDVKAGGILVMSAEGDILNEDEAALASADSIVLTSGGDIGRAEEAYRIDSMSGTSGDGYVSASAENIYITEVSGDLKAGVIAARGSDDGEGNVTGGDAVITAEGSILDNDPESAIKTAEELYIASGEALAQERSAYAYWEIMNGIAGEKAEKAEDLEKVFSEAEKLLSELEGELQNALIEEAAARKALEDLQADTTLTEEEKEAAAKELTKTLAEAEKKVSDLTERTAKARSAYEKARDEAEAARAEADAAQADADAALRQYSDAHDAYERAKALAEDALRRAQETESSVSAAGSVILTSGEDIGSASSPLEISSGGQVSVTAAGDAAVAAKGDLVIGHWDAGGNAVIVSTGSVSSKETVKAPELEVAALGGDIGSAGEPLNAVSDKITASASGDIHIRNGSKGELTLGPVIAGGDVSISTGGSIASPAGDGTDIVAEDVNIVSGGSIGKPDEPLKISAQSVSISGKDMDLEFAGDTEIVSITGGRVNIVSDGRIDAGDNGGKPNITAAKLDITSLGDIGSADHPLYVYVPWGVNAHSVYGAVHIVNGWKAPSDFYEPDEDEEDSVPDIVRRPDGSRAPYEMEKIEDFRAGIFIARFTTERYNGVVISHRLCSLIRQLTAGEKAGALYIRALADDGKSVTKEDRVLVLEREFLAQLRKDGVRLILFRVGGRVLVIDVEKLDDADWSFTVYTDGIIPRFRASRDGKELTEKETKPICHLALVFESERTSRDNGDIPR